MIKQLIYKLSIFTIIIFSLLNNNLINGFFLIIYLSLTKNLILSIKKYNDIFFLEPKFILLVTLIFYNAYFPFLFVFLGEKIKNNNFNLVTGYDNFSIDIINESSLMGFIFIIFIFLGIKIFENNKLKLKFIKNKLFDLNYSNKKFKYFFSLGLISIIVKFLPYINYGIISNFGKIGVMELYVNTSNFFNTPTLKILDYFFRNNLYVISFPVALYYLLEVKNNKIKIYILNITFFLSNFIFIFFTYRRLVPILSIIGYLSVLILKKLKFEKKKLNFIISIFSVIIIFLFFFSLIRGNILTIFEYGFNDFFIKNQEYINDFIIRNEFSGVNAVTATVIKYRDSFVQGTIFYGLIAPFPLIDKVIYNWVGIENNPSILWISQIYNNMYASGGGLSFNPIAESLLIGGIPFLIIYGFFIGAIISIFTRKNRNLLYLSLLNIISFSFARYNFSGFFSQLINMFILLYIYSVIFFVFFRHKK